MKFNLRFFHIADNAKHRKMVHRELDPFAKDMPIDQADTTVTMSAEGDGRIDAQVHLTMPGPDIKVSASDYTMEAVLRKLGRRIREVWKHRVDKRSTLIGHLRLAPSRVRR